MPDAPTPTPNPLSGSIAGTVRGPGGKPVVGATVWLDASRVPTGKAQQAKVVTLADGLYAFHFLPAGTFGVTVVPPAGMVVTDPAGGLLLPTLTVGMQVQKADFTLAPIAPPAAAVPPVVTPTPTPAPTAPPPVTPPVVVPPVPTPVPAVAGIFCGTGATASPTTNYAGTAPFIAVLSAAQFTGTRTHRRQWHLATGAAKIADPRAIADPVKYAAPVPIDDGYIGQPQSAH